MVENKGANRDLAPKSIFCQREPKPTRLLQYTPLNAPKSHVLEEALQANLILPPIKSQMPPNANMKKHCRYHHNYGHRTNECDALRYIVEELVQPLEKMI